MTKSLVFLDFPSSVSKFTKQPWTNRHGCSFLSGKAVWVDGDPNFKNRVVLRPSVLADVLRILFHHDLNAYLHDPLDRDEYIRRYLKNASSARLVKHRTHLLEEGILEPELTKALLGGVSTSSQQLHHLLTYLCDDLELGYAVGEFYLSFRFTTLGIDSRAVI